MADEFQHHAPLPPLPSGASSLAQHRAKISRRRSVVPPDAARLANLDWPLWLGLLERKRRALQRAHPSNGSVPPAQYYVLATCASFGLEGIELTEKDVLQAIARSPAQRRFRSSATQRIRNHVAILYSIENALRMAQPLKTSSILRWYTSISSGLSTTALGHEKMLRLDQIARRLNSPQLRLQPAVTEIAHAHAELLADPLFPSFNGILARLLLRYHLGRCSLPFVVMETTSPPGASRPLSGRQQLILQLLMAINRSYDLLLG